MALVAVSGHPGCRFEEVARIVSQRLGFELLTQSQIQKLGAEEFGAETEVPLKAWPFLVTSILAHLATEHHLVYCAAGGELQARHFPGLLRAHVVAPENVRIGNLMLDCRLDRSAARQLLLDRSREQEKAGKIDEALATVDPSGAITRLPPNIRSPRWFPTTEQLRYQIAFSAARVNAKWSQYSSPETSPADAEMLTRNAAPLRVCTLATSGKLRS